MQEGVSWDMGGRCQWLRISDKDCEKESSLGSRGGKTAREGGAVEGGVAILKKGNLRVGQSCLGVDQFYLLRL